jgi:glutamate synthase (NADPH/NADH) small chain
MPVDSKEMSADRNQEWRNELRGRLSAKERSGLPRCKMPERQPMERVLGFLEVNVGLEAEAAVQEAKRCLDCSSPTCVSGCPVNINIPGFIKLIEKGDFLAAAR